MARNLRWVVLKSFEVVLGANAVAYHQLVVDPAWTGYTVLRVHGQMVLSNQDANVLGVAGWGMMVAAENILVGGLPSPLNEVGADWFVHRLVALRQSGAEGGANLDIVDGKSMRKVHGERETVYLKLHAGAGGMKYAFGFRILLAV